MSSEIKWMATGGLLCALYVTLGAFGAHGLEDSLDVKSMATYQTGLRYMIIHALALILINLIGIQLKRSFNLTNYFITAGILLFSFGLVIHATRSLLGFDLNIFAYIAPIGGVSYVIAWVLFSLKLLKK